MTARPPRGLNESISAWSSMAKVMATFHALEMVDWGDEVVREGRSRLSNREGNFRQRRQPGSFGSELSSNRKGATVFVNRDGTSPAAEFGAKTAMVFGKRIPQTKLKSRTAGGWSRKGKIVGPEFTAIKAAKRAKRLADRGLKTMSQNLDRHGVPKR
jgi:hypothetical protein